MNYGEELGYIGMADQQVFKTVSRVMSCLAEVEKSPVQSALNKNMQE